MGSSVEEGWVEAGAALVLMTLGRRCMLIRLQSTGVRIDASTHDELKRLAVELNTTVGNTVSLAVRALRQDRIGGDLTTPLRQDEVAWLDADRW